MDYAIAAATDRESLTSFDCRRFALALLGCVAVSPILVAAFIIAVDPYYVFGSPSWPGINAVRPYYETNIFAAKPYQVRRIAPAAVALGSSRVEVGLDPRHPGWVDSHSFNFGLPGSTSYEVMLAFLHAQAAGQPLKQAVIGLDFFGFNIFFPRAREQQAALFARDGVRTFADFLATDLAKRPRGDTAATHAPGRSAEQARDQSAAPQLGAEPFDPQPWNEAVYLAIHPDVAAAVARKQFKSGHQHYQLAGRAEGRESGTAPSNWNEALYLKLHPDVAAEVRRGTFVSGYHHYLAAGRAEGRESGMAPGSWDETLYLKLHPDVAAEVRRGTFVSGFHHYLAAGRAEGREGGRLPSDWNEAIYLRINPDAQAEVARGTFINGYHHYLAVGRAEQREGGSIPPDWDEAGYLQVNPDVVPRIERGEFPSGYHHYRAAGRVKGLLGGFQPSDWNEAGYIAANPEVRVEIALGAFRTGYLHYAALGREQGLLGGFPPADIIERLRLHWPLLDETLVRVNEMFRIVASRTALKAALATILRQSMPAPFDDAGVRLFPGQDETLRRLGGAGNLIRNGLSSGAWGPWLKLPRLMYCFTNADTGMTMFDPYRFMLRRAYAEGTDVRMFVTPVHAVIRTLQQALGLGERYEFWLKELVRINEQEAARAGRQPFPLWDFSDPNTITRDPVPLASDPGPMQWYWEHSHYRKVTGDLILDRIFGHGEPGRPLPSDFGVRLAGGNIGAHIARARTNLEAWASANSDLVAPIVRAARTSKTHSHQAEATCW